MGPSGLVLQGEWLQGAVIDLFSAITKTGQKNLKLSWSKGNSQPLTCDVYKDLIAGRRAKKLVNLPALTPPVTGCWYGETGRHSGSRRETERRSLTRQVCGAGKSSTLNQFLNALRIAAGQV